MRFFYCFKRQHQFFVLALLTISLSFSIHVNAQRTGPEQNICTPYDISCNPVFYTKDPYTGIINQTNPHYTCGYFFSQTKYYNYVFLQFTANADGFLRFTITPNVGYAKYGFHVFDKTAVTTCDANQHTLCSADDRTHIPTGYGPIGAIQNPPCVHNGQNGCAWQPQLPVVQGRQYVIFINYENDGYVTDAYNAGEGFTFNASASSPGVFSNTINFTPVASPAQVCNGGSTTLTATGGPAGATYTWTGGGINQTGTSVTVSPTATTTYTVTAKVGACTVTKTITVNVASVSRTLNITGNGVVCGTATSNLCASVIPAENTGGYTWTSSVSNSFTNNPNACGPVNVCTTPPPAWNANTIYLGNLNGTTDIVSYNGRRYAALWWSQGQRPDLFTWCPPIGCPGGLNMWKDLGPCFSGQTGSQIDITKSATYTVTYKDLNGCTVTGSKTVQFVPSIVLTAATSKANVCKGQLAQLSVTGGVTGMVYTWTAPAFSYTGTPVNVYPNATTTYTVTGTVPGSNCDPVVSTVTVTVEQPLVITAQATPATICAGGSSVLLASGGSANAIYAWTGNGVNATGSSITVSPAIASTYQVSGVEPGSLCAASKGFVTVNVESPVISVTGNDICGTGSVCASVIPVAAGGNFTWSSASTFTLNPNSCGTTYTCTDPVYPAWNPAVVYVNGNIVSYGGRRYKALWWTLGNQPNLFVWCPPAGCVPLYDKMWQDLGVCYQGNTSSRIDITQAGIYTVQYTSPNGCIVTQSKTINSGSVTVAVAPSVSSVCVGNSVSLTANATPAAGTTYTWSGPNGYTATGQNIVVAPAATPTTAVYTVAAQNGICSGTASATLTVNPGITIVPGNSVICPVSTPINLLTETNTYLNLPAQWAGSGVTYTWTPINWVPSVANAPSGATSGSGSTIIQTLPNTGNLDYTLTATVTNSNGTCTSPPANLHVRLDCPVPVVFLSRSAQRSGSNALVKWTTVSNNNYNYYTFYVDQSTDGINWTTKGSVVYNLTGSFSYTVPNVPSGYVYYRVRMINLDGKLYSKTDIFYTARFGELANSTEQPQFTVAPNPAAKYFTLNTSIATGTVTVRNTLGEIVYTTEVNDSGAAYTFGHEFASGMYYVTLTSGSYSSTQKLIKE